MLELKRHFLPRARQNRPPTTLLCAGQSGESNRAQRGNRRYSSSPGWDGEAPNHPFVRTSPKFQSTVAACFGRGFPARRLSASLTARRAAVMALLVVDSGPSESVLAKKTRSIGSRARGCTLV